MPPREKRGEVREHRAATTNSSSSMPGVANSSSSMTGVPVNAASSSPSMSGVAANSSSSMPGVRANKGEKRYVSAYQEVGPGVARELTERPLRRRLTQKQD